MDGEVLGIRDGVMNDRFHIDEVMVAGQELALRAGGFGIAGLVTDGYPPHAVDGQAIHTVHPPGKTEPESRAADLYQAAETPNHCLLARPDLGDAAEPVARC